MDWHLVPLWSIVDIVDWLLVIDWRRASCFVRTRRLYTLDYSTRLQSRLVYVAENFELIANEDIRVAS